MRNSCFFLIILFMSCDTEYRIQFFNVTLYPFQTLYMILYNILYYIKYKYIII